MKRILLVEDDLTLGSVLHTELGKEHEVQWARTKNEALNFLKKGSFDLAILDIGLPDGSGFDVAEALTGPLKPHFLFLTAQNDPEVRLRGFEIGAEDFIPKPYHLKEVLMRVNRVLSARAPDVVSLPHLNIHLQSYSLQLKNGSIQYPPVKDMKILKLLIESSPAAVSRDEIIDKVWGEEKDLSHRTIDNAILRLRQALQDENEQWIRTVRGIGYQWVPAERSK